MKIRSRPRTPRSPRLWTTIGALALATAAAGLGAAPASAVVTIPPPVPANDEYTMEQGTTLDTAAPGLLANDDEGAVGAGPLKVTALDNSNQLSAISQDGSFTYTPDPGFVGTYVFKYWVKAVNSQRDSEVGATVTITVTPDEPDNVRPNAEDDSYTTAQGVPLTIDAPGILGNDSDPDGDPITACDFAGDQVDWFEIQPDGSLVFTPTPDFVGTVKLTYWVCDDHTLYDLGEVTVVVTPAATPTPTPVPETPKPETPDADGDGTLAATGSATAVPLAIAASAIILGGGGLLLAARARRRRISQR